MRESELLKHIFKKNQHLPESVSIPPGDDMGAMCIGNETVLVTVDQIADGIHVNVKNTSLELIARKAIVRNLSDVAAMAAKPVGAVASACLPIDFGQARADQLFDAMSKIANQYNCPLIGGDVSLWDHPLLISVTVFAEPAGISPILRSGAKQGDGIFVTGQLGGAWDEQGGGPHLEAEPRLELARIFARLLKGDLHAMIDLSDGLASDLRHICEQSGVDAEVELAKLPIRSTVSTNKSPGWFHAMTDGEDYELCFTVDHHVIDQIPDEIAGVKICRIGTITSMKTEQSILTIKHHDGTSEIFTQKGWEHRNQP